ncbi:hypothetical protein [Mesorhizobium sp.]|uniref:hypothetical protein n=1 Tax=Mesorhizobium sp. TaxID=1871066 RepID=UPI0025DB3740|nr:hypothetical protein [Mesorhizobium sp.]
MIEDRLEVALEALKGGLTDHLGIFRLDFELSVRDRHAHWLQEEPGWEEIAGSVADFLAGHRPAMQAPLSRIAWFNAPGRSGGSGFH